MPYFEQWCPKYFWRITSYKAKITYCPTKENMQCALEPDINIPCPFNITEWKPSLRKRLATFCNSSKNIFINKSVYWLTPIACSFKLSVDHTQLWLQMSFSKFIMIFSESNPKKSWYFGICANNITFIHKHQRVGTTVPTLLINPSS